MEKIASKSQLTEGDMEELSQKIDKDVAERLEIR